MEKESISNKWDKNLALFDNKRLKNNINESHKKVNHVKKYSRATFYQRASAWCWDILIFQFLYHILNNIFISNKDAVEQVIINSIGIYLFLFIAYTLYHILLETIFGTTIGKYLVGIRVIKYNIEDQNKFFEQNKKNSLNIKDNLDEFVLRKDIAYILYNKDNKLSLYNNFIRFFSSGLSWITFNIGHYMIKWRADKLSLHDIISGTQIIYDNKKEYIVNNYILPKLSIKVHKTLTVLSFIIQGLIFLVSFILIIKGVSSNLNSQLSHFSY